MDTKEKSTTFDKIVKFLSAISKKCEEDGNTLLHHVVKTNNVEFIEYLIAAGNDVNVKNKDGHPPLYFAVCENCLAATKILLRAGAKHENSYFRHSEGPLHIAAERGFFDIVQLLIDNGADVNARDSGFSKRTPLHIVNYLFNYGKRKSDRCSIIKTLVKAGANINEEDDHKKTPLHIALQNEFEEEFELLLSAGADINVPIDGKRISDRCSIIKALVKAGANINEEDVNEETPLHIAFRYKFEEGFELLLSAGADINVPIYGRHILFDIVRGDQLHNLKRLLELDADINVKDKDGNSLLHEAFEANSIVTAEFLFDNGLNIREVNKYGDDPLTHAIKLFTEYRISFNNEDYDYDGTYDCKDVGAFIAIIDLAVKRGANVNRVIRHELTILYVVLDDYQYHSEVVRALLKHGATFDFKHPTVQRVMSRPNGSKFPSLLLRHAAMFHAQGRDDGPLNFDPNMLTEEQQKYYAVCRDELDLMKVTNIMDLNATFFDILFKKDISGYARNESIVSVFETQEVSKSFPIYSDLLTDRFSKELKAERLTRKASEGLSYVLRWDENSMRVVLNCILSYLDKKDLNKLSDI